MRIAIRVASGLASQSGRGLIVRDHLQLADIRTQIHRRDSFRQRSVERCLDREKTLAFLIKFYENIRGTEAHDFCTGWIFEMLCQELNVDFIPGGWIR